MNERFVKIPCYFYDDGLIWFNDLWINPFQIESFLETDITYTDPSGEQVETNGTKIYTKSGMEHDVNLPIHEFIKHIS
jgi:hypothetical protein